MQRPDFVNNAQQALMRGEGALFDALPAIITRIIEDEAWREKLDEHGNPFKDFQSFVEYRLWWGLAVTYDDLIFYCKKDKECVRLLEVNRRSNKQGAPENNSNAAKEENKPDNIRFDSPKYGTSKSATMSRLKRDFPHLWQECLDGKKSPNQAAIEAGFRRPMKSIPTDSPTSAMEALRKVFTPAALLATFSDRELIAEIEKLGDYRLVKKGKAA